MITNINFNLQDDRWFGFTTAVLFVFGDITEKKKILPKY